MADVIRVKARKDYRWHQDAQFVHVTVPVSAHATMNKLEMHLTDYILRITSAELKTTQFLDLCQEVDFLSPENKFVLAQGELDCRLKKKQVGIEWPTLLLENATPAEIKARRKDSELRYQQEAAKAKDRNQHLKEQYDRKATQQLMAFEEEERKRLQRRKQNEKQEAIKEVFRGVDEKTGRIQRTQALVPQDRRANWEAAADQMLKSAEQTERLQAENRKKNVKSLIQTVNALRTNPKNAIFDASDIADNKPQPEAFQQIPVRQRASQKVKFTEKMYPHMAARQSHMKEPPFPKPAKTRTNEGSQNNPLLLKAKGDTFVSEGNYAAALQAYNEAIRIDSSLPTLYSNRSICHLKMLEITECLQDCQQYIALRGKEIAPEQNLVAVLQMNRVRIRMFLCKAYQGDLELALHSLQQLKNSLPQVSPQKPQAQIIYGLKSSVESYCNQIMSRIRSNAHKLRGDELYRMKSVAEAKVQYLSATKDDTNQYGFSNLSLCLSKQGDSQGAIEAADRALKILNDCCKFNQSKGDSLALKLYYRKSKELLALGQVKEAEANIQKGLSIASTDPELQVLNKQLKAQQNLEKIRQTKNRAAKMITDQQYEGALKLYSECLRLCDSLSSVPSLDFLGILQNQCVCYSKLDQFDSVISVCIRILKQVAALSTRAVGFGAEVKVDQVELNKIQLRTLMRRANAYVKTNNLPNARADLEEALRIEPNNNTVENQLKKLKAVLGD